MVIKSFLLQRYRGLKYLLLLTFPLLSLNVGAQNDTLRNEIKSLKKLTSFLHNFRFSGFALIEWQLAQTEGQESFAGGNFNHGVGNRFLIREGRFKVGYEDKLVETYLQIDASLNGVILIDFYGKIRDPWLHTFYIQGGQFNRPFGHEIANPSNLRETPERSRLEQSIFTNERDCGFMAGIELPKEHPLHFFKIQGGLFNGSGRNFVDFDSHKDFIGQVSLFKELLPKKALRISGGMSFYNGSWKDTTGILYHNAHKTSDSTWGFHSDTLRNADGSLNRNNNVIRRYYGLDMQIAYDIPKVGTLACRAEYVWGQNGGTTESNLFIGNLQSKPAVIRNFDGFNFYLVQTINIKNKPRLQAVFRYDYYDPNKSVSGNQIGGLNEVQIGKPDIKFQTYGVGINAFLHTNFKLMLYYDFVRNEATRVKGYEKDIKDDLFTIRIQASF